ncbi:MAG: aldo/keto reductase [Ostreibacterium sp.]
MKYNKLGNSHLNVSEICLGSMTWGQQNTEKESHEQLDYATDQGVNFIDTAEMYAIPASKETYTRTEQYIGNWLTKKGHRDNLIIATKISGPGVEWVRQSEGLTPAGIDAAIEGSLKRLKTDYIDLYQLHWPQRLVNFFGRRDFTTADAIGDEHILELLQALKKHIDAGRIREVGLSNETPWGMMKYLQYYREDANLPRMQTIQNPYSLLQREFDNHSSEVCFRENISMLAYSPLAGGILSGKYLNNEAQPTSRFNSWGSQSQSGLAIIAQHEVVKQYIELSQKYNIDPTQMALSFVTNRFFVDSNIIGVTTMSQLKTCIDSVNLVLPQEVLAEIESIHSTHPNPGLSS